MIARTFAIVFGAVYTLVGLLGFTVSTGMMSGNLLGLFPVNVLHNAAHIVIGLTGIAAYFAGVASSRNYAFSLFAVYTVLAVAGLAAQPFLGIIPLGGLDIGLHVVTAVAGLAAGLLTLRALSGRPGARVATR